MKKLYNIAEAAILVGVSTETIRRWIRASLIQPFWGKAGGEVIQRKQQHQRAGYVFDNTLIHQLKAISADMKDQLALGQKRYWKDPQRGLRKVA